MLLITAKLSITSPSQNNACILFQLVCKMDTRDKIHSTHRPTTSSHSGHHAVHSPVFWVAWTPVLCSPDHCTHPLSVFEHAPPRFCVTETPSRHRNALATLGNPPAEESFVRSERAHFAVVWERGRRAARARGGKGGGAAGQR